MAKFMKNNPSNEPRFNGQNMHLTFSVDEVDAYLSRIVDYTAHLRFKQIQDLEPHQFILENSKLIRYRDITSYKGTKLWSPKENDLCWFYNDIHEAPILSRFRSMVKLNSGIAYSTLVKKSSGKFNVEPSFKYAEPYIVGELPIQYLP